MAVEPIITNLSNEEYHTSDKYSKYWSSTQLRNFLKGPAEAKALHDDKTKNEETPAMRLGSIIHEMLEYLHNTGDFTLEEFEENHPVFVAPVNPKTGVAYGSTTQKYADAYNEFKATLDGKEPISAEELFLCHIHAQNIENNKLLKKIIVSGTAEASHFIDYAGVGLKWRPDLETKGCIFDWKTISTDLGDDSIRRRIIDSGYDVQAAMYQSMTFEQSGTWKNHYIVWFQTVAPYKIRIDSMQNFAYAVVDGEMVSDQNRGAVQFQKILDAFIYCETNDAWPTEDVTVAADEKGNRIHEMEVPAWAANKITEFYF